MTEPGRAEGRWRLRSNLSGLTPAAQRIAFAAAGFALVLLTWNRIFRMDHLHDQGWFEKYFTFAGQILEGHIPYGRIGDVSPGYLWLTVLFRQIGLGVSAIRHAQIAGVTVAAVVAAAAARKLGGWVAAVATVILILGNRAALVLAAELEPETLILLLNAAALCFLIAAEKERAAAGASQSALWLSAGAGLFLGLSAIARPSAMLAIAVITIWIAVRAWRLAAVVALAAALPIGAILVTNGVLTGNLFIMQPGAQFYDANNPLSTGCAGVLPLIVSDLDAAGHEPDFLHVAYRIVSGRATGNPPSPALSNRYWSGKALAWVRHAPAAELSILAWKALLSVHHYDIYDLVSMKRKSLELARYPAIPFGVSFVLALVALVLCRNRREMMPVALFALCAIAGMILFNVSARQRNGLLAPLGILAGAGIAEIVARARARDERALYAFGAVMVLVPLLGLEGPPMREEAYVWQTALRAHDTRAAAYQARTQGDRVGAAVLASEASVLDTADPPLVSKATLRAYAMTAAQGVEAAPRLFDIAIALEKAEAWREADAVLATLGDYRPRREARAVSSVAYYRARAAVHLRVPRPIVQQFLDEARRDSPGDPQILALRAVLGDADSAVQLDQLHDPFTRDYALAHAWADVGNRRRSAALLGDLVRRIPEWRRPAMELAAVQRPADPAASGQAGAGDAPR